MPDNFRLLGHDLKQALAAATAALEHVRRDGLAEQHLAELRRALADAEHVADALLDRRPPPDSDRPAIDVNAWLAKLAPSLKQTLDPASSLAFRPSRNAGAVLAHGEEIAAVVRRLVHDADRATRDGGEVTVDTSSLDFVSTDWPRDRFWPRRHVRITIGDTGHGDRLETWQRVLDPSATDGRSDRRDSIAAMIGRLDGFVLLESADGEGSRVHVCVPAVSDVPTT